MPLSTSRRLAGALFVASIWIYGCKLKTTGSESLHDFGKPAADSSTPPLWVETSVAVFQSEKLKGQSVLPPNHPKTQRLQAWADELHKQVTALSTGLIAPRPLVAIVERDKLNAFVSSMQLCVPVTITAKPDRSQGDDFEASPAQQALSTSEAADGNALQVEFFDGSIFQRPRRGAKCLTSTKTSAQIRQILDFAMGSQKGCITYDAPSNLKTVTPHITLDVGCLPKGQIDFDSSFASASTLIYRAVPNVITFYDGIFDLSEEEAVHVLAHELGHYYRLHPVLPERRYGFFYLLDKSHNLASKPAPLPAGDVMAILGQDVVRDAKNYLKLAGVPQQKLSTYFFKVVRDSATGPERFCSDRTCVNACTALRRHFDKSEVEFDALLGYFPNAQLPATSEAQTFYREYEQKLESCLNAMRLSIGDKVFFTQWLQSGDLKSITEGTLGNSEVAWDAVQELNRKIPELIKAQNNKIASSIEKANQERLGYYTDEQEADEIAIEMTSRIGLDPNSGSTSFLKLLQDYENKTGGPSSLPGNLGYKECLENFNKGFPDFVPIASYADPHHSPCYRIYNNFRELKAHQAELKSLPKYQGPMKIDSNLWKTLQQMN